MEPSCQNEFSIVAVPTQAQARRFLDLAASGMGPLVMNDGAIGRRRQEQEADDSLMMMALWELSQAVYRETQARILHTFAIDDEASRRALAEIDELLAENARRQQEMIDAAAKMDDGTAMFLTEDGTAIYTEHGSRLADDQTQDILTERRPELEGGPSWEGFDALRHDNAALLGERAAVVQFDQERAVLEADVNSGKLTQEELEGLEVHYETLVPERVQHHREDARAERAPERAANEVRTGVNAGADAPVSTRLGVTANSAPQDVGTPARTAVDPLRGAGIGTGMSF